MQAWFLTGPGAIELRDVPDPQPGPHEAVVRVEAVGICGSDAECFAGKHPLPNYPRLPGHEFSGAVAAVGSAWEGVPVGTRVAADPAISCGRCYACRQGRHNCCVDVSIAGVHRPGAMAGYTLCRESQLYPMPDAMSFEAAALVETLSIGAQAVHRAGVQAEDRVVILGGGPIGLCALLMARHAGAKVLLSEPLAWRLALAGDLGAEVCVNPAVDSVSDAVQEFTGGYGAHVVVDATGETSAAESSLALVGSAGRVVILTLSEEPIRVRPWQLVRQELTILGSRLTLADLSELLALAASGEAPLERLATHRYPLADAERAFRAACERPEGLVKAVVLPHA
jgi:L-gulonate 5-dehydrogenase